jgi:hypothetical protein
MDCLGDGVDAADGGHAESDASQEDSEAAKAATHLAQRKSRG